LSHVASHTSHALQLNLSILKQRGIASELWEQAVRGPPGQENWRGETIDRRSIQISEEESCPWDIPEKGLLEVVFTSFNKGHFCCCSVGRFCCAML
jgi:hypothetical protein